MESHLELKKNHIGQEAPEIVFNQSSHQASKSTKLRDRFKRERNDSFSVDFRHEVPKETDYMLQKSKAFHRKQESISKADELVRYMSSLPSYLEKGENLEEKALNVGVLEWRRLEKWQNQHVQVSRSCKSSPSNGKASSYSSTEGSSFNSGRGHSCSPANQRMCDSSMETGRGLSRSGVLSRSIKSLEQNNAKFRDLAASSSNYVKVSQSILSTHKCFNKYTDNRLKEREKKDQDTHLCISQKSQTENCPVMSGPKGKWKLHDSEPLEVKEKSQSTCYSHDADLLRMKREQESDLAGEHHQGTEPYSASKHQQGTKEASRKSFSGISDCDNSEVSSDIPYSCPLPREDNVFMKAQIKQPNIESNNSISSSELIPFSTKFPSSPSRVRNLEGKKSVKAFDSLAEPPNAKMDTEGESKARNPSPIRRMMARLGRNSNTKDTSCLIPSNSDNDKFRLTGSEVNLSSVDSSFERSNAAGKGRSTPLRRLLDPLHKPRASNVDNSDGSAKSDILPMDRECILSKGQGKYASRQSMKVKLDLGSCKSTNVDHPQGIGKCEATMVQALFQVVVKNGLPLFTLAVDNCSDILAATMRKLNSGKKDGNRWVYTFFTIHEMKKKISGWLNHGAKDRTHGYVPNVVAQMKVSDVASIDLTKPNLVDHCTIREFVLIATKKRQGDERMPDLLANDELAATVLKLPKMSTTNVNEGDQKMCKVEELAMAGLKEPSAVCGTSESMQLEEGGSSIRNLNPFGLAVILPGGDHGLPTEGEPSPLIERWKSGGSCDCGGWDLGCRLKVLASQYARSSSASVKAQCSTGKFHLYLQDQGMDKKPIFSLSPFQDGIYSVEFDSTLKLLQAFSICIAVLNGLQPAKFFEFINCFEKKSSEEATISGN